MCRAIASKVAVRDGWVTPDGDDARLTNLMTDRDQRNKEAKL
jgi:hypothetical protein